MYKNCTQKRIQKRTTKIIFVHNNSKSIKVCIELWLNFGYNFSAISIAMF